MDANILLQLLAKRIAPGEFQLWGLEVHWMSEECDNPVNRAIVADVIANYATLAAEYEVEQIPIEKRLAYKTEADPIYAEWQALLSVEHIDAEARRLEWLAKRAEIAARFV